MNEFLAELYNTRETIGAGAGASDVEKLAEAQILDQMFEAEGIDVNQLPDETIVKVAHELFGANSALVKMAAEGDDAHEDEEESESPEEEKKEHEHGESEADESDEDKVAQADFLGRVMAHSFVQERDAIEKDAGLAEVGGKVMKALRSAGSAAKKAPGMLKGKGEAMAKSYAKGVKGTAAHPGSKLKGIARLAKEHKKTVGGLAGGAALAAGGGAAAAMHKKSSALDTLAEQRALEILAENGIGVQSDEQAKLASAVEQRAYEMLVEAGYITE